MVKGETFPPFHFFFMLGLKTWESVSDHHSVPTNELSCVVLTVVLILSQVTAFWVSVLLWGVIAFTAQGRRVTVCWRDQALSSGGGGGWVGWWGPRRRSRVGRAQQRSALRVSLCCFLLLTTSCFLIGVRLRVLRVVSGHALFAHGTGFLGLGEPRVDTLAVIC